MANRLRGEIAVPLDDGDGKKRELIFRLGINELIGLQAALGLADDDEKFLATIDKPGSFKRLRTMAFWGFRGAQAEITEAEVGDIITQLGIPRVRKLIDEAIAWGMPDPEPATAAQGPTTGKGDAASPGALPS